MFKNIDQLLETKVPVINERRMLPFFYYSDFHIEAYILTYIRLQCINITHHIIKDRDINTVT